MVPGVYPIPVYKSRHPVQGDYHLRPGNGSSGPKVPIPVPKHIPRFPHGRNISPGPSGDRPVIGKAGGLFPLLQAQNTGQSGKSLLPGDGSIRAHPSLLVPLKDPLRRQAEDTFGTPFPLGQVGKGVLRRRPVAHDPVQNHSQLPPGNDPVGPEGPVRISSQHFISAPNTNDLPGVMPRGIGKIPLCRFRRYRRSNESQGQKHRRQPFLFHLSVTLPLDCLFLYPRPSKELCGNIGSRVPIPFPFVRMILPFHFSPRKNFLPRSPPLFPKKPLHWKDFRGILSTVSKNQYGESEVCPSLFFMEKGVE